MHTAQTFTRKPNRLIGEKSPYLKQHAYNPVDWYPWGDEALEKARREDKPIFLSIGYSTCHWCHVMAGECFENEEIAARLRDNYVSIKVDREERPDLDHIYMTAVQLLTSSGGWPLSVFLTPDLKAFFGGTYFPPEDRRGMPGFITIIDAISRTYRERRADIEKDAESLLVFIKSMAQKEPSGACPGRDVIDAAFDALMADFDPKRGGFGLAPKFPQAAALSFLLAYHYHTGKPAALDAVTRTLTATAEGGIRDHVGGGFHRYSTDNRWLIPHFEKMLYDNALLAKVYLEAYLVTRNESYRAVARETLDYVLRDMTSPDGGFYTAEDADSEGVEGKFYAWTFDELRSLLEAEEFAVFKDYYGVATCGVFDGANILNVSRDVDGMARERGASVGEIESILAAARAKVFRRRQERPRPLRDDKIIASLNALMISALCKGYQVLREERYLAAAEASARFIINHLYREGTLYRSWIGAEARVPGFLDDYAFLVGALLDLYETTFDAACYRRAYEINEKILSEFSDTAFGGFYDARPGNAQLVAPVKEYNDFPIPSGNSIEAANLYRLAAFSGEKRFLDLAEGIMKSASNRLEKSPAIVPALVSALFNRYYGAPEILISAAKDDEWTQEALRILYTSYVPQRTLALASSGEARGGIEGPAVALGRFPEPGGGRIFICEHNACREPITSLEELRERLSSPA